MPDSIDLTYASETDILHPLGAAIEGLVENLLAAKGIPVHSVTHRVKSLESATGKIANGKTTATTLSELHDLLGVRVITYFADQVGAVSEVIEAEFDINREHSVDKRELLDADRFGYLSVHYLACLAEPRKSLAEYTRFDGCNFEVQIRSILQHSWAEIEHDLGYKSASAIPKSIKRRFSRLAGLLEIADDEFATLRTSLEDHAVAVRETLASGGDVDIDQDSVFDLMKTNALVGELDRKIIEPTGARTEAPIPGYASHRAAELRSVGITSVKELLTFIDEYGRSVAEFAKTWLEPRLGEDMDRFGPAFDQSSGRWRELPTGLSLFYIFKFRAVMSGDESLIERILKPMGPHMTKKSLLQAYRDSLKFKGSTQ